MFGRPTASQIAPASLASFLPNNQMRRRDERFKDQARYKALPDQILNSSGYRLLLMTPPEFA